VVGSVAQHSRIIAATPGLQPAGISGLKGTRRETSWTWRKEVGDWEADYELAMRRDKIGITGLAKWMEVESEQKCNVELIKLEEGRPQNGWTRAAEFGGKGKFSVKRTLEGGAQRFVTWT
jgi:hypothetical protein